jgi:hypothetical protein
MMPRKGHTVEQIVAILRQVASELLAEICLLTRALCPTQQP